MTRISSDAPAINANYAATVINRAAEIFADLATDPGQERYVVAALDQARDEFMAGETRKQLNRRTYGLPHLRHDLRQYITSRYPEYADSFTPITDWSAETAPAAVVETLREAAFNVGMIVEERTRTASKFDTMSYKELNEYDLIQKAVSFLTWHGLSVSIAWDRENPDAPLTIGQPLTAFHGLLNLPNCALIPKKNPARLGIRTKGRPSMSNSKCWKCHCPRYHKTTTLSNGPLTPR